MPLEEQLDGGVFMAWQKGVYEEKLNSRLIELLGIKGVVKITHFQPLP